MRMLNKVAIKLLRLYQLALSPYMGMQCKFAPSCSEYACECFNHYGFVKSLRLTIWRVARCNPWSQGGHDPVVKQTTH